MPVLLKDKEPAVADASAPAATDAEAGSGAAAVASPRSAVNSAGSGAGGNNDEAKATTGDDGGDSDGSDGTIVDVGHRRDFFPSKEFVDDGLESGYKATRRDDILMAVQVRCHVLMRCGGRGGSGVLCGGHWPPQCRAGVAVSRV